MSDVLRETLPEHLVRAYPDGRPDDLVPIRLVPVEVFGADECDRCGAGHGYGLLDAAEAGSDCNRASQHLLRRDDDWMNRRPEEVITVWVPRGELEKFDRALGDPRPPLPVPDVHRFATSDGRGEIRVEATAWLNDAERVPIPNAHPSCGCRIEDLRVAVEPGCPFHGEQRREDWRDELWDERRLAAERAAARNPLLDRLALVAAMEVQRRVGNVLMYGNPEGCPVADGAGDTGSPGTRDSRRSRSH